MMVSGTSHRRLMEIRATEAIKNVLCSYALCASSFFQLVLNENSVSASKLSWNISLDTATLCCPSLEDLGNGSNRCWGDAWVQGEADHPGSLS